MNYNPMDYVKSVAYALKHHDQYKSGMDATQEDLLRIMERGDWGLVLSLLNFRAVREDLVRARKEEFPSAQAFIEAMDMDPAEFYGFEEDTFPDPTITFLQRYAMGTGQGITARVYAKDE